MSHMDPTSQSFGATKDGKGLKKTLKRWKDKWRTSSTPSSRTSSVKEPLSRLPSNASSAAPSYKKKPSLEPLPPIPASPPVPTALFTPTTETFIHSPADPRNRSRSTSKASSGVSGASPPATLRKPRPVSRRNTAPTDFLTSALHDDPNELPMNVVTTTIVAGNGEKRKRTSRLRLSISRRGSILASSPSSPSLNGAFERCSSRATTRLDERSQSRTANRISMVPESESDSRERVDSERESLFEETELIRRRPKELGESDVGTVELAYQYVGSRDGKKG